jgi:hypothetical protein
MARRSWRKGSFERQLGVQEPALQTAGSVTCQPRATPYALRTMFGMRLSLLVPTLCVGMPSSTFRVASLALVPTVPALHYPRLLMLGNARALCVTYNVWYEVILTRSHALRGNAVLDAPRRLLD